MPSRAASKVLVSSAVAFSGDQRSVTLVFPFGASSKVTVVRSSSGHVGLNGWRVRPPASSEKECTHTRRSGAKIHLGGHDSGALRAPPLFHAFWLREALPHEIAWRIEDA